MSLIFFVDPGPKKSGFCLLSLPEFFVVDAGHESNVSLMRYAVGLTPKRYAVEGLANYGAVMGKNLRETAYFIGAFRQQFPQALEITRPEIVRHFTGKSNRPKSAVNATLYARFGVPQLGPCAFRAKGATAHARDALAGAVYIADHYEA